MITELNAKQEAALTTVRDEWLKIGLQAGTKLPEDGVLLELFAAAYKNVDLPAPKQVFRLKSPLAGAQAAALLERDSELSLNKDGDLTEKSKKTLSPSDITEQLNKAFYGTMDSEWLSFYSYFNQEFPEVEGPGRLVPLMNLAKAGVGWCWLFDEAVVVTPVPKEIHMQHGRLNNPDGPAIVYDDGYSVYALNGVRFDNGMERFITESREELLENPSEILGIKNAEQRAETIKRVGIKKLFEKLNPKKLDSKKDYELYEVNLGTYTPRKYLKMLNPSVVGEIHLEAVHPDCKTVEQALNYRNFGEVKDSFVAPVVLT